MDDQAIADALAGLTGKLTAEQKRLKERLTTEQKIRKDRNIQKRNNKKANEPDKNNIDMNKLREIIEYRSKSQREDFLEYLLERGIDEEEREEIISIILSYFPDHNDWTLVLLIDLSNDEELISKELLNVYLHGLLESKTYYIKLSILDYLRVTRESYREANIAIDFSIVEELVYGQRDKIIVKNQALLFLMESCPDEKEKFLSRLNQNLERTNDYRVFIRLYNSLMTNDFYKEIPKNDILDYIQKAKILDLGEAARVKSEELKSKLKECF